MPVEGRILAGYLKKKEGTGKRTFYPPNLVWDGPGIFSDANYVNLGPAQTIADHHQAHTECRA